MSRNTKKWIASVAALQILLYHCWIPVFPYGTFFASAERFLVAATYSGVDLFFFISAFSLVSRPVEDYGSFLGKRAVKLLPLFFIAWIAGQFLWFIPSIMLLYIALPPLYKLCRKQPTISFFLLLIGWAGLVYLVLGVIRPKQDFGLFLFRIPSMILGAYAVRYKEKLTKRQSLLMGVLLLAAGMILTYRFGYMHKLNTPYRGTFYMTGIPVMLGTVLLVDRFLSDRTSRVIERFGSMTLELYFSQMVFGTWLVSTIFRLTESRLVTNLCVLAAVTALAAMLKLLGDLLGKKRKTSKNSSGNMT